MKAMPQGLTQTDLAPAKGSSSLAGKKASKASSPFGDVLKKAVKAEKGKGEKLPKDISALALEKGKEGKNSPLKTTKLATAEGKKASLVTGKKVEEEKKPEKLEKEAESANLTNVKTTGLEATAKPKEAKASDSLSGKENQNLKSSESVADAKDASARLVKLGGREILTSVEDLRTSSSARKANQTLASGKKLASFEKEMKTSVPKPEFTAKAESLESTGFFTSESRVSSSQSLLNNMRKDAISSDTMFWNEWEAKVESQIVDKARIILKDGEKGEIQLRLYPEKLGNVRVRLDMEGNQVFARFIVDNAQVKQVFESNSLAFQQSLEQSGLNVSLDFSTSGEGGFRDGENQSSFNRSGSGSLPSSGELIETINVAFSSDAENTIDMVI